MAKYPGVGRRSDTVCQYQEMHGHTQDGRREIAPCGRSVLRIALEKRREIAPCGASVPGIA
eukprot:3243741-Rhodomonas_salina.1